MNVWSSGNDRITYDDATKKYQFVIDGEARMAVTVDGSNCVIALMGHGIIQSNGDLRIHLDENQDTQPTNAKLKVFSVNTEVFSVNEYGDVEIQAGGITTRTVVGDTGNDSVLRVARTARGRVEIRNQAETTQEFPQPKKAGILVLYDENGNDHFLWVDSNGKLRIRGSDPGANDLSGTVVGTQS